ncbi:MAG: hypothetical protein R3B82_03505 [Sandaracinaceae bacterium]
MENRAFLLLALMTTMVAGCVETQPPVNRVQPNVTRKSDLLGGDWYMHQTVVDSPYTTDFTFVGETGELERIRWEVQEEFLVARRAYESVAGADGAGINGTTDSAGAPVAMYAITSHFDIRHQYNPVTGERLNVIEENSTDRPWNEREYMRVDWSQNLVSDPNFMMLARYFNGLEMEPVQWYVQDENDPNAPVFVREDPEDDASRIAYMDITNKMFVRPTTTDIPGLGPLPSCFLFQIFDGDPVDCAPSEITVRNSFMRVDESRDYQPMVYTGDRMDRFGYFVRERPGYDEAYGLIEPARYRFITRHNLWQQSHLHDADGAVVTCTADADCADGRGSVCDTDYGRARRELGADGHVLGACTLPFRDRTIRPIAYHLTENFPADLLPEMRMLEEQWNSTFVETVDSLRANECAANGGGDCAAERGRDPQIFHVCESPVPEGADPACGPAGTIARIGDLRYSLIGYVNEPHRASPLGYGPNHADPETGEIIAGTAYLYGAGLETLTAYGRDIVRLLNNDLTEEEIQNGDHVRAWIDRMNAPEALDGRTEHVIDIDGADAERFASAMDFSWAHGGHEHARGPSANPAEMIQRVSESFERLSAAGAFGNGTDADAILARLQGTEVERMMVNRDIRAMAGIDPDLPVDASVIAAASPLQGMSLSQRAALERARNQLQVGAGLDWGEFADDGLLGLARAIQRAAASDGIISWHGVDYDVRASAGGIDYEAVRSMLRHPIMSGLALHEVGHSVGLRHNFSGSFDSLNYQARYWELRDDGSMRPRAWDPETEAEIDGRIREYQYSTVMDYGNNFVVTDADGLGHYDHAAIKMGYGDLVEVFESVPDADEMAWFSFIQNAGWPVPITLDTAFGGDLSAYTYTEIPGLVGGREALERRVDVPYSSLTPNALLARSGIDYNTSDPEGRIAVPYRFCSDEQADLSPGCYRYDSGADAYESVQSVIDSYWNYYIFSNFRRGRIGFNVGSSADRTLGRFFRKLQRANQTYALYRGVFQDVWSDVGGYDAFWTNERGMGGYTLAVSAAYQLLLRVITSPEPGGYSLATRADGTQAYLPGGGDVRVNAFDGRYLETTWDFDAGYFWFDQLERVGYFYDKVIAIEVLTDPTTYFLGRDTDADIRRYQLNFANTFGPSMSRFFGGLQGEDWATIAPRARGAELDFPDAVEISQGDMPGTPIAPNASFSIQLYAAIFGTAFIPQTYDQDYLNRSRVWVRGGAEEVDIDPSLPLVEYTDPTSGLTYVSVSYPDTEGVEHGVGAQLIVRAQRLRARADAGNEAAAAELDSFIDNLDLARLLTWYLGFGAQP